MRYDYSQSGYHHLREVSFEVSAILHDEEKHKASGDWVLRTAILGSSGHLWGGYPRESELSFNPVSDQQTTAKYVTHKHKMASRFLRQILRLQAKKETKSFWSNISRIARSTVSKAFDAVVQKIVLHELLKEQLVKKLDKQIHDILQKHKKHPPILIIGNQNQVQHQTKMQVNYNVHPHVDALLRERAHIKALHL